MSDNVNGAIALLGFVALLWGVAVLSPAWAGIVGGALLLTLGIAPYLRRHGRP